MVSAFYCEGAWLFMQTRLLGKSGLEVSEVGIGCWGIGGPDWNLGMEMGWGNTDDELSLAGLRRAYDLGANHFDTADVYGHGRSERLIGKLVEEIPRDKVIIGTKVGYFHGCAPNAYHPLHMRHQLEMSLENLKTDYVDIYYLHNFNFGENNQFLDGAIEAMYRFKEEGKVRAIGLRGPHEYAPNRNSGVNDSATKYNQFILTASLVKPEVIQVRYNMISPTYDRKEKDIFNWAEVNGVGVVINKPLGQGLLLDKYDFSKSPDFAVGDHRLRKKWFSPHGLQVLHKRLAPIKARFGQTNTDMVRVALQYCLARSLNACVVAGFKNPGQVDENLAAAGRYLSQDDIHFIQEAMLDISEEIGKFF